MNITINLEGIQENKKYNFEFCLSSDGNVISSTKEVTKEVTSKTGINIDDFKEEKKPQLEDVVPEKKKMVITSTFTGKINEGDKI